MFKTGIKVYFKNLKFIFTVVGVLFLVLLIGLCFIVPSMIKDAQNYGQTLVTTINSYNIDGQVVVDRLRKVIFELNWNDPYATLVSIFNQEWLTKTFYYCLGDIPQTVKEQIVPNLINISFQYAGHILEGILNTGFTLVMGIILSYFVTKVIVDFSHIKRRFFLIYAITIVINTVLVAGLSFLLLYCAAKIGGYTYLVGLGVLIVLIVCALFCAYLTESHRRVKLKEVINAKNFFSLFLVTIIIWALSCGIFALLNYYVSTPVAITVGIPLFILTIILAGEVARVHVYELSQSRKANN